MKKVTLALALGLVPLCSAELSADVQRAMDWADTYDAVVLTPASADPSDPPEKVLYLAPAVAPSPEKVRNPLKFAVVPAKDANVHPAEIADIVNQAYRGNRGDSLPDKETIAQRLADEAAGKVFPPNEKIPVRTNQADIERIMADPDFEILLAILPACCQLDGWTQPQKLLGTVLVERYKRTNPVDEHVADIGMLSVHPDQQGTGIGGSLVAAGEEFARTHFGLTDAELWAFTTAELGRARVNWYSKLGYELTGEETTLQDLLPPWVKFQEAAALWTEVDETGMPLQEGLHFFRMRKKLPTATEAKERGMKIWQPTPQQWPTPFVEGEVFMLTAWSHKWYEKDEGEPREKALLENQYRNRELLHQLGWMGRDLDERPMPKAYWRSFSFSDGAGWNPFGLSGWREDGFAVTFAPEDAVSGRKELLKIAHGFEQLAIYSFHVEEGRLLRRVLWTDPNRMRQFLGTTDETAPQAFTEAEGTRQYYVEVPRPSSPLGGALWHGADGVVSMKDRHVGEPESKSEHAKPGDVRTTPYAQPAGGWEGWLESWRRKMDNWWGFLPAAVKPDMAACFGALGLHLASRMKSLLGEVFIAENFFAGPPPTATAAGVDCDMMVENMKGSLPDFPDFPDASKFELPPLIPIPRLLPTEVQLGLSKGSSSQRLTASALALESDDESASVQMLMINASGGFAAGVALVALVGLAMHRSRGRLTVRKGSHDPATRQATCHGAQSASVSVFESR